MNLTRSMPHLRAVKFAPFALLALFLLTNFTGLSFSPVFAPSVNATTQLEEMIPQDLLTSGDRNLDRIIYRAGRRHGIDPRFIHAVIWQESKYKSKAVSHAGAEGLMQLMPATARRFGCTDPSDLVSNVEAGTKYLSWLLKRFHGDVRLALAGYNAGEGAVDKYNGVPPYSETQNYVRKIVSNYGKAFHPVVPSGQATPASHLVAKEGQASLSGSVE
ncbi:MAG TPA: lytic transglycosylase domain-containing protein [Pyrinomonadaceae bacterium]|nr:lytic transglycosylase domain-containing protein [Pyrinomonadaceae bacterium]